MSPRINRHLAGVLAGLLLASLPALPAASIVSALGLGGESSAQQTPPVAAEGSRQKKNPLLKLAEPWPSAEELRRRQEEAEARPFFSSADPIAVTLASEFKTVNKDRDSKSTKRYPAELRFTRADGRIDAIPVKLGARGQIGRASCRERV